MADEDEGEDGSHDDGEDTGVPLTVLVNPVITPIGEETNLGFEACLSVPGMAGPVRRFNQVHVTYQTLAGEDVAFDAEGFHARVIQHECDHLDGVLYPMRMTDMSKLEFNAEPGHLAQDIADGVKVWPVLQGLVDAWPGRDRWLDE